MDHRGNVFDVAELCVQEEGGLLFYKEEANAKAMRFYLTCKIFRLG